MAKKDFEIKQRGSRNQGTSQVAAGKSESAIFSGDLVAGKVMNIDVTRIEPNPYQPRLELNDGTQKELMASIEARGLLQPIVIQKRAQGGYTLVSGQRRLDAFVRLGREIIPAIVREGSDADLLVDAIVENIQREGLNPLEIAISIERLKNEKAKQKEKITYDEIAALIGKDKATVSKLMSLLKLDKKVQERIAKGDYKVLQVLHMLNRVEAERQYETFSHIVSNKLNREDAIAYISSLLQRTTKSTPAAFQFNADEKKGKYSICLNVADMSKSDKQNAIAKLEALIEKLKVEK